MDRGANDAARLARRDRRARARRRLARARLGARVAAAAIAGRRSPLFVGWSLTDRCTASCAYCGRPARGLAELDERRALALAGELVDAGVARVSLTGGEPLLHPACAAVARRLARAGVAVSLNTNGELLPDHLDAIGDALTGVVLSVDGDAEVHDAVRGAGSHARTVRGARAARRAGLPRALHLVATRHNVDRAGEVLRLAGELDAAVGFSVVERVPAMGRRAVDELAPSPAAWRALVDELLARKRGGDRRIQNSSAGLRYLRRWPESTPIRCSAGRIYARIEPDGGLYGCGNLVDRPADASVARAPFAEAFRRLPPRDCDACWCDTRVEMNLILSGSPSALRAAWRR